MKFTIYQKVIFASFLQSIPNVLAYLNGDQSSKSSNDLVTDFLQQLDFHHGLSTLTESYKEVIGNDSLFTVLHKGLELAKDHKGTNTVKHNNSFQNLKNIFDYLEGSVSTNTGYRVGLLDLDDSVFTVSDDKLSQLNREDYEKIFESFTESCKHLPTTSPTNFLEAFSVVIKIHFSKVPYRSDINTPVSLYEYLRIAAAISGAIVSPTSNEESQKFSDNIGIYVIDVSGIQSFIYQISRKSAASTLKGRSFYLGLLIDQLILKILEVCKLHSSHVLMNSGGKAYILIPNEESCKDSISALVRKVNIDLLNFFSAKLFLNRAFVSFKASDLNQQNGFAKILSIVASELETSKKRKFSELIDSNPNLLFSPSDLRGLTSSDVCKVTGTDLYNNADKTTISPEKLRYASKAKQRLGDDEEESTLSEIAHLQINIGKLLKRAKFLVVYNSMMNLSNATLIDPLLQLKGDNNFPVFGLYDDLNNAHSLEQAICVYVINKPHDVLRFNKSLRSKYKNLVIDFKYYGANKLPFEDYGDKIKEFSEIAHDGRMNALGVIRMDVDSLGIAFRHGFDHLARTDSNDLGTCITRISTLSQSLDTFFSGYLNFVLENFQATSELTNSVGPNKYNIYPVYAGGDDIFIVTRWDHAPLLAKQIREEFGRFTNTHPAIGLSAGIAVVDDKSPIHVAARDSEIAESKSKSFKPLHNGKAKDALTYLGYTIAWEDMDLVLDYIKSIKSLIENDDSKAVLGLMRLISVSYNPDGNQDSDRKNTYGSWRWRSVYRMKRMENDRNKGIMNDFSASLFSGTFKQKTMKREYEPKMGLTDYLPFITKWLHGLTRTANNNE